MNISAKSLLTIAAALAASTAPAMAQAKPSQSRNDMAIAAGQIYRDNFEQVPVRFPGGVSAWRDIVYRTEPNFRPLTLDIYVPAGKAAHPLVVYIHGGGWFAGNTRQSGAFADFPRVLATLAAEGFTVASIEYRLSGEARFPAQLRDVNAALRFLRKNEIGRAHV